MTREEMIQALVDDFKAMFKMEMPNEKDRGSEMFLRRSLEMLTDADLALLVSKVGST